jgi:FMN phosphatase YigB (HAD superfamily)
VSDPGRSVTAVVFDVGETLVDETRLWTQVASDAGVPAFTFMATLGGLIARREHHRRLWEVLGIDPVPGDFASSDFYPDALACLARLRGGGYLVGMAGNTPASTEAILEPYADFVGSSARWGAEKPSPAFFDAVVAECRRPAREIAYVGDRVDNDVAPALAAGLTAVHIRRGPWGHLEDTPPEALAIAGLENLPAALV